MQMPAELIWIADLQPLQSASVDRQAARFAPEPGYPFTPPLPEACERVQNARLTQAR